MCRSATPAACRPIALLRLAGVVALSLLPRAALAEEAIAAAKFVEFFRPAGLPWALIYVIGAIVVLRAVSGSMRRIGKRFAEYRLLAQQLGTILRFGIYLVTCALVVRSLFRLERETVLALLGASAVAIGFGLKDLAASVLAGIVILFDRPFQVGDRVTFAGYYGEIRSIGLRSVRLVTLDDSTVTIPNNRFLTEVVTSGNSGALDMQIVIDFYIDPDADLPRAKRIVEEAARTSRFVYLEKPLVVLVSEVMHETYLATRLRAKAYVLDVHYEKAFETDVTERVKEGFAICGISSPSRRTTVSQRKQQPVRRNAKASGASNATPGASAGSDSALR